MKYSAILLGVIVITGCCKTQTEKSCPSDRQARVRTFDSAIENLSYTAEQLEQIRREKDFFIKVLEDFERQQAEYGNLVDSRQTQSQKEGFAEWQQDIELRERRVAIQHAFNVFVAHSEVLKRKSADPNSVRPVGSSLRTTRPAQNLK